jgi:hypothetical protein
MGRQPQRAAYGASLHDERRRPEQTALHGVVQQHAVSFFAHTEASTGSELPRIIKDEFDALLECSIRAHGFRRWHCAERGHGKLLALGCKRRGFCPSRILPAGRQPSCEAEMQGSTPWMPGDDSAQRKHAPATLRNREPIAAVLQEELPVTGKVLEVASGSGEHCAFFAELFPGHVWQPTDPDPGALGSIASWCAGLDSVLPALALDAASADWPVDAADAVLCINMAHISPWEATLGLVAGAQRLLAKRAPLILYGPWRREGVETAPSNEAFNASLKARDPRWGLRRVKDLDAAADARAFARTRLVEMPANNLMLVYRR